VTRTLVVTTTFPQYPGDPRGAFLLRHWSARAGAGGSVRFLAPRTAWCAGDPVGPCEVVRFRYAPRAASTLSGRYGILENLRARPWRALLVPPFGLALRRAVARQLASWRPDLVVAHWLLPAGWAVAGACGRRGIPFDLYGHGTDVDLVCALPGPAARRLARCFQGARRIALPGADRLARFRGLLDADGPPLAVETLVDSAAAPPPGARSEGDSLLFLGRLIRQKGVDDLLAAVALLEDPPRLHVAGEGPERRRLERLARRLGVAATFHGFVEGAAKEDLLRGAGVLCVPSKRLPSGLSEGAPLVIAEGLAWGLRVVATRVGGIPDVCAGRDAVDLVAPGEPASLARALARSLDAARGCDAARV